MREVAVAAAAPDKPRIGEACNGCGVCCALETCPLGRVRFLRRQGPCPALHWQALEARYACGLVVMPAEYMRWLPSPWQAMAARFAARSIAAGRGCDCDADVDQLVED